jgi:hypothetical protein
MGNVSFSITNNSKEILLLTLTQINLTVHPNLLENSFKALVKVEGLILEGSNEEEQLISIIASEHLSTSPAYFFKAELEKMPSNSKYSYKLNLSLDSVECLYNQVIQFITFKTSFETCRFSNFLKTCRSIWITSICQKHLC